MQFGNMQQLFWKTYCLILDTSNHKDEGSTFLQNNGNVLTNYIVPHSRRQNLNYLNLHPL